MTVLSRRLSAVLTILAGLGLLGCNEPVGFERSAAPMLAQGGLPAPAGIPLEVNFRGDPGDAFANVGGSYVNGQDQVLARTDQSSDYNGKFEFDTDINVKQEPNRTLLIQVFTTDGSAVLFPQAMVHAIASTGNDAQSLAAFTGLQVPGETAEARLKVSWSDASFNYDLRYGTECGGIAERSWEKVVVTLTATAPRAYLVTNKAGAVLCKASTKRGGAGSESFAASGPFLMAVVER